MLRSENYLSLVLPHTFEIVSPLLCANVLDGL